MVSNNILPYPQGWFQIAWSDQIKKGKLKKITQFGKDFVLFRGEDGKLGLLDDLCPHLGAKITEGGCVIGNSVRCPYHHWAFDKSGQCTNIPYANKIPSKAKIANYSVEERYGNIYMFRNKDGFIADYELPTVPEFDENDFTNPVKFEYKVKIQGQDMVENSVDSAHFAAVHRHATPTHDFTDVGEGRVIVKQKTKWHYFGMSFKVQLNFHMIEPGISFIDFCELPAAKANLVSSFIPIDKENTVHRFTVRVRKSKIPGLSNLIKVFIVRQMRQTYKEDLQIWENKEYLPNPILCDGDRSIRKIRSWYSSFYDPQ